MKRYLQPFLEPGRSIPLYLLGTAVIALLIQFGIDWSNNPGQWQGSYTLTLFTLVLTLVAGAVWAYQNRPRRLYLLAERKPRPRRGLIVLVSPHSGSAPAAVRHHQSNLTDCWLVATPESAPVAAELASDFSSGTVSVYFGSDYQVSGDEAASTFRVVRRILTEEAPARRLRGVDLIADMTGGSKPMTTGLVLACASERCPVQYVLAEKDEEGQYIPGAYGEPIKIETDFLPTFGNR